MGETLSNFLLDFARLLYERAEEAQEGCHSAKLASTDLSAAHFECGRALAYYEVVSALINQAEIFGVPSYLISREKYDPDQLLNK